MEPEILNQVCKKVYEQFPILDGVTPEIKPQPNDAQLLIFTTSGKLANQKALPIHIRVNVNKMGEIVKITSSR